jgi:GH25 family lysozyme M1 (1,4-beta-N-acetylmuramidase)
VTTARVIDISSWQHPGGQPINWPAVLDSGVQGVIVKLTQGTTYLNPYGVGDIQDAAGAGLLIGAYHFCQPGQFTPTQEANWFLKNLGGIALDLGAWLDIEDLTGIAVHEVGAWAEQWLDLVQTPSRSAGVYTDRSIQGQMVGSPWGHRLWLAVPGQTEGPADGEWMTQTGSQDVPGVSGATDVDVVWNTRGLNLPPGANVPPPQSPPPPADPPTTTEGTCTVNLPILAEGNAEQWATKACQLILRGFDATIEVDGIFGPQTKATVEAFQGKVGVTVDGVVGAQTWGVLLTGAPQ